MKPFKKKKTPKPITREELERNFEKLEKRIDKLEQALASCRSMTGEAITKVACVRYNPFREIGGDQSFSIALLDEHNDGVIVTSHYGRDTNRVYAKQIVQGVSEHSLSKEEEQALAQAVRGKPKE